MPDQTSQPDPGGSADSVAGPMVEAKDVWKRLGSHSVLRGATFSVPAGEVYGLAGSNGSGKTTMLRVLATLEPPDDGDATIAGISVREAPDQVKGLIGYVPESFGSYPLLTAADYLESFAGVHGVPKRRRAQVARELLGLVAMADLADEPVDRLGAGHKRRLCIARAMVDNPKVLLVDDLASLDLQAQADLADLLARLRDLGKTVVIASNHVAELERFCTWIGLLEAGSMVASGPVAEIRRKAAVPRQVVVGLAPPAADGATGAAPAATATEIVAAFAGVETVESHDEGLCAHVGRTFDDQALLAHLVARGVPVRSMHTAAADLGQDLLRLTAGHRV